MPPRCLTRPRSAGWACSSSVCWGFEDAGGEPAQDLARTRSQWARVVLPDGGTGYTAPGSLMSLTGERLCYIKDLVLGWRIAGFIAAGNQDGDFAAGTAGK